MVVLDQPQRRRIAHLLDCVEHRVEGAGGGARRILRVQRQHQHAIASLAAQIAEDGADRRFAVAHRPGDAVRGFHAFAEISPQQHRLFFGMQFQRGAFPGPDLCVLRRGLFRPGIQNDAVKNRPPDQRRYLDHARIGQKLLQVGLDRPRGRCGGRPEIDQKNASPGDRAVLVPGFGKKGHGREALGGVGTARNAPKYRFGLAAPGKHSML